MQTSWRSNHNAIMDDQIVDDFVMMHSKGWHSMQALTEVWVGIVQIVKTGPSRL